MRRPGAGGWSIVLKCHPHLDPAFQGNKGEDAGFSLGAEGVGTVAALGEGVEGFEVGDSVCFVGGAFAEHTTCSAVTCWKIPELKPQYVGLRISAVCIRANVYVRAWSFKRVQCACTHAHTQAHAGPRMPTHARACIRVCKHPHTHPQLTSCAMLEVTGAIQPVCCCTLCCVLCVVNCAPCACAYDT